MPQDVPRVDLPTLEPNALQRATLAKVVDLHPVQLTIDELVRELTDTPDDFATRDRIEIAVQQLVRTGLVHRHGVFVLPTRAVLRAIELGVS